MEQGRDTSADQDQPAGRIAELESLLAERQSLLARDQAIIAQQQVTIAAYQEQLERQREQLALLKRALFSSRRERYVPSPDQKLLFSSEVLQSLESDSGADATPPANSAPPSTKRPRRRGKKFVFPEGLPVRRQEFPLPPEEQGCSCCQQPRVVISQQVTRQLELEPAQAYIVEYVRYTYACPKCRSGEQVQTTAKPPLPIEKSPFGPSVLAAIVVYKFARHLSLYLQSDGYAVYTSLTNAAPARLIHVGCWAHARRKFEAALYTTSHPLLHEALAAIGQLYDVETRAAALPHDARVALRQAQSRPILERLHQRLSEVRGTLRPRAKLSEAVEYALARWPSLLRYLEDGRLAIDTNHLERQMRPVAQGRNNWLFLGRATAGSTAAILYTVVQSARMNCVDVLPYLTDVLRRLPAIAAGDTAALDELLPDRWLAAHPEHRLVERERESRQAQDRRKLRRAARRAASAAQPVGNA